MTYKQLHRAIALLFFCIAMVLGTSEAKAQLSVGADLNSVFSFNNNPALLVKYKFAGDRFAARLGLSGMVNSNKNNQNFYEDNRYSNLDAWPSDVPITGSEFSSSTLSITPGIEYRKKTTTKLSVYGALECGIVQSSSENEFNNHSAFLDPGTDLYTIVQIFSGGNSSEYRAYVPALRLGVDYELGHGFSTYGEFGVSGTIYQQSSENEFERYFWDGVAFEKQPEPDKFKEQDVPWSSSFNYTPTFRLFLAYTFQKAEKE